MKWRILKPEDFPTVEDYLDVLQDRVNIINEILGDGYDIETLRDIVSAQKAGRYVIFPKKIDVHRGKRVQKL